MIGGWLGRALSDELLPRIREAARRQALHLPFSRVEIVKADLGPDAVALGGATLPIAPDPARRITRLTVSPG